MQLLVCLLFLRVASTLHLDSLGRPVLAQRLLQPRFQAISPVTVGTEEETCLSMYAFYKAKCPQDQTACPGRDCASALDSFKCCLKQSYVSPWEMQQGGVTVVNVTRWEALGLTALWLNIRRALITRAEVCEKHGFESFSPCTIPDFPPVQVDLSASQALYQTQIQKELLSALAETQAQELQIRRDMDDFGLSDQIKALSELKEREAVLRSQLAA